MKYTIIKSNIVRLLYLIITAGLCLSGIIEAYDGTAGMLKYFTYISNIMVFIMLLCQIIIVFINMIGRRQGDKILRIPAVIKGWIVICISFTFLTVFLVLNPFQMPGDWQDAKVHYLVPLLTVVEFIFFEEHGRYKAYYPLCWGLTPIVYYGYVMILYANKITFNGSYFPYFFMNYLIYGWGFVVKILFMLLLVFMAFGYLMYFLDRFPIILEKYDTKKKFMAIFNMILILAFLIEVVYYTKCGNYRLKVLTSAGFVTIGALNTIYSIRRKQAVHKFPILLMSGLVLSMMGDIAINHNFISGAVFFALGHILYFSAYCCLKKYEKTDLIPMTVIAAVTVLFIVVTPFFDFGTKTMWVVCITYAIIISSMLGKAVANLLGKQTIVNISLVIGSILFYFSDVMLAFDIFSNVLDIAGTLCSATYFPAQCILAFSIFLNER